ncbi:branched-chain amino acid transport system II carrier protein [Lactiplantibacillus plantarum]|uniref:branched-chain amino acid transport system II carrier protein n=1 Tax=Lactiplantibacillus plantarum TaxID=1590 RepID=UPI000CF8E063|nr:branched-chain amino acid transport system II carrier protein [Lactiplantibacillus plantarum]MCW6101833.1 branched-chain amino acid transport system II carrier protein [Lactiplantibacillus plantarum]MCW6104942.1 branched-chain amino acid transport system II carrier protein [Lactiplantibacillus plantarum]SPD95013.1 Branched-chain amino acid transport system 2 carrier protein [Lactiplantibacillus plantarum]VFI65619.1 Branched-chain amino acid transport system 2 carrier protein [Lactiplantibaci
MLNRVQKRNLTKRDYVTLSSMIFALFFGAGNLIFPLHLGQLAGGHWGIAAAGFLITAVLLPLLSVLAVCVTKSKGVYDIGKPLGATFAVVFMVLIHFTIGPFFGTPRTATVSFTVGLAPFFPAKYQSLALLLFSAAFFGLAYYLSVEQSKIMARVGKLLNPLFLLLLVAIFAVAFSSPLAHAGSTSATAAYQTAGFTNGFLQGYNTMDALAGLALGVTIVTAVNFMGQTDPNKAAWVTARAGFFSMAFEGLIYVLLILLGAQSLGQFKLSDNGGVAFDQIVNHYMGNVGQAILAVLIITTCLTTAIGLVAAFAQDFHKHFGFLSYKAWLRITCLASFLTANVGLNQIIAWSTPVLMFLYPLAMALIFLSILSPLFHKSSVVYVWVVVFTVVPAVFDMVAAFPAVVSQSTFGQAMAHVQSCLPLASSGMDWLVPALVGAVFGTAHYLLLQRAKTSTGMEVPMKR